nr:hypothetical protein [Draconibacterium orientale]
MRIAIHQNKEIFNHSTSWETEWINYCDEKNIDYEIIDCFSINIIEKLRDFDLLLWHIQNYVLQDMLFARSILQSAKQMGLKVFPDYNTSWHFDDKVAQMFLLQSIKAPIPNHWFFATKESCKKWINSEADFPVIAKLKCGAGSNNVKLLRTKSEALMYATKMFNGGLSSSPSILFKASSNYKSAPDWSTIKRELKESPILFRPIPEPNECRKKKIIVAFRNLYQMQATI